MSKHEFQQIYRERCLIKGVDKTRIIQSNPIQTILYCIRVG